MQPKHVWQFWEDGSPPDCVLPVISLMQRVNPTWSWNMLSARAVEFELLPLVEQHVPNVSQAYKCIHGAFPQARSDFVRYAALLVHGGVWLDVKSSATVTLDDIFGGEEDSKVAHFSTQALAPRPHTLLTWACAAPTGHPALRRILRTMTDAMLDWHGDIDASGKSAVLWLTGPRLLTRALDCRPASSASASPTCKAEGIKLHQQDFEGRLIYDATVANPKRFTLHVEDKNMNGALAATRPPMTVGSCYRNSSSRAQYQRAVEAVRTAECRTWLKQQRAQAGKVK